MYRRPATQGPLQGVSGGAYAGRPRVIDAGKLPPSTKARLAKVLSWRAEPSPIARVRPSFFSSSAGRVWAGLLGAAIILVTFATGFTDPASRWELQPKIALLLYLFGSGLIAASLLDVWRRRFVAGEGELRPGRYLLPLDLVDVAIADARDRQLVTVTPLGNARDAQVRGEGRGAELVIAFEDTSRAVFPLTSDPEGSITLRRLEHAQRLLEDLTYTKDIEKAFAHDPFFDLRVDDSWSAFAPSDDDGGASLRTTRGVAAAGALLLALGVFAARNSLGEQAIAVRELRAAHERALQDARDGSIEPDDLEAVRQRLAAACLATLRPGVVPVMKAIVERAVASGDPAIPVRFVRRGGDGDASARVDFEARERVFVFAFARVFSEKCHRSIVTFVVAAPGRNLDDHDGLAIDYEVAASDRTWKLPRRDNGFITVHGPRLAFRVVLSVIDLRDQASFELAVPPPARPSMAVRDRSIFSDRTVDDGTFDERVYDVMAARAFDRLYDEVWSLFFDGDPRVPLDL